jgi:hypothetical protein
VRRAFDHPKLALRLRVVRVVKRAPHQRGKDGVLEEGAIFQALRAPLRRSPTVNSAIAESWHSTSAQQGFS